MDPFSNNALNPNRDSNNTPSAQQQQGFSCDDVTSGGCALLSLLACQSSCAEYANDPSAAAVQEAITALGPDHPIAQPIPPSVDTQFSPPPGTDGGALLGGGVPTSEWVIERRGLAHMPPWNALPRSIRPKAKLPGFLRAGWQILELIRTRGLQEFQWMVQDNHVVASSRCPQTYIYTHDSSRAGRKRPLLPGGLTITTEGGGHFWTEGGASGAAPAGTEGVFACSARDAHGELLLGKCFRRARLVRDVSDRSVSAIIITSPPVLSFLPPRTVFLFTPFFLSPFFTLHPPLSAGEKGRCRLLRYLLLPPSRRARAHRTARVQRANQPDERRPDYTEGGATTPRSARLWPHEPMPWRTPAEFGSSRRAGRLAGRTARPGHPRMRTACCRRRPRRGGSVRWRRWCSRRRWGTRWT